MLLPALLSPVHWMATFFCYFPAGVLPALVSTPLYLLEREIRHDITSGLTVLSALLGMLVSITLAFLGQPLWALIADTALLTCVPGVGAWIVTRWRPTWRWDRAVAREIWAFATTVWTTGLLGIITFQFDDGLVGRFRGDRMLGFYSRAYAQAKIPLDVFGGVIAGMSLPLYSQSLAAGKEFLMRVYAQTTWILARLIALSSIIMLAATEEIVRLWVGDNWLPMVPLIRLMSLFIVGRPLFQNHGIVLLALGKERQFRFIVFIQAAILLAAGLPAVLIWGAEGVAVVVSVMMLVGLVISEIYVTRLIKLSAVPVYALPGLLTVILTVALYWVVGLLGLPLLLALIAKTAAAVLLFGGAMVLLERPQLIEVIGLLREHLFKAAPKTTAVLGSTEYPL
jgi:PST family polysaccharide transporter/lipopolysaccharide exporter